MKREEGSNKIPLHGENTTGCNPDEGETSRNCTKFYHRMERKSKGLLEILREHIKEMVKEALFNNFLSHRTERYAGRGGGGSAGWF